MGSDSEMVERGTRALIASLEEVPAYVDASRGIHDVTLDGSFDLAAAFRAAIEAMREPTDGMIADGSDDAETWRAMIDAALREEPHAGAADHT